MSWRNHVRSNQQPDPQGILQLNFNFYKHQNKKMLCGEELEKGHHSHRLKGGENIMYVHVSVHMVNKFPSA